jgi:hypothetical protein
MNIQLDDCAVVRPSWCEAATRRGTVPKAYQTKPVMPAQKAAMLKSRKYDMVQPPGPIAAG